jgi:hypothetical protein
MTIMGSSSTMRIERPVSEPFMRPLSSIDRIHKAARVMPRLPLTSPTTS